jgi:putative endonuclease
MGKRKLLGQAGEDLVEDYLKRKKFKILEKNFTSKIGEIDIIAQKENLIVFVEVKARKKTYFPISSVVNPSKQRKIILTAHLFIVQNGIEDKICRFDVATVVFNEENHSIEYIDNAFQDD